MTVQVGDQIPSRSTVVDAGRMKVFSLLTDDPNPIHWDRDAVAALGLGDKLINQGGLNVGYVINAVSDWAGGSDRIVSVNVRFRSNVLEGEEVVSSGTITEIEDGVATIEVALVSPTGANVISGTIKARVPDGSH